MYGKHSLFAGAAVVVAVSLGLAGMALAKPLPVAPGMAGPISYDQFEMTFESLGADDGTAIEEPTDPEYPGEGGSEEPDDYCSDGCVDDHEGTDGSTGPALTTVRTTRIVTLLDNMAKDCAAYAELDRIDCLRDKLQTALREIPSAGRYDDMRRAVQAAVLELDAVVRQNLDPSVAPVRRAVRTPNGLRANKTPIRRIAASRAARANAQASAVLDKLSTTLLRSSSDSATKRVHYERAAQAINSAKVLLRST
ncbi:hypothetical protein [Pseudorhodobacter sp.]|uniref:hypothetical protein n=1 Tax=Pseudorhodobacter sp. TaxID=1934400 RepID=UPI0026473BA2|nr:hypothetical protein [Pseudorhodobacter sp.]MDN5788025.1 hypothetical protein [Pseudorhodobacter sp.]